MHDTAALAVMFALLAVFTTAAIAGVLAL